MREQPRFLFVAPREDGWRSADGTRRYFHGGDRYRKVVEESLAPYGEVSHLEFGADDPIEKRSEALDAMLDDVDAVVASPWLGLGEVAEFDVGRLRRAPRLKVIAGTFDYRLGWID